MYSYNEGPYQVSQDVVVALCILALFNNLEDKVRGETEWKTNKQTNVLFVSVCVCVSVTLREVWTVCLHYIYWYRVHHWPCTGRTTRRLMKNRRTEHWKFSHKWRSTWQRLAPTQDDGSWRTHRCATSHKLSLLYPQCYFCFRQNVLTRHPLQQTCHSNHSELKAGKLINSLK